MDRGTARKKKFDFSIVRPSKITIFEYSSLTILLFCFVFVLVFFVSPPLFQIRLSRSGIIESSKGNG